MLLTSDTICFFKPGIFLMHEKYFKAKKENFNEGMKEISAEKQEVSSVYRVFYGT